MSRLLIDLESVFRHLGGCLMSYWTISDLIDRAGAHNASRRRGANDVPFITRSTNMSCNGKHISGCRLDQNRLGIPLCAVDTIGRHGSKQNKNDLDIISNGPLECESERRLPG